MAGRLVNLKARVEVGALHHHQGSITSLQFHKGTHLISASEDGTLAIWRTKDWELMKDMRGHTGAVNSVAIHPSGQIAVSVARDRTMRLWDLTKGRQSFIKKMKSGTSERARVEGRPVLTAVVIAEGHMVRWDHTGELYALQYDRAIEVYRVAVRHPCPRRAVVVVVVAHPPRLLCHHLWACRMVPS